MRNKIIKCQLIIIYLLNCLDIIITLQLMNIDGMYELNPLMRLLITYPVLALLFKFIIPLLMLLFIWKFIKKYKQDTIATLMTTSLVLIAYLYIVINNLLLA